MNWWRGLPPRSASVAGTFGLKSGLLGYELCQAVGEPLFKAFKEARVHPIVTKSSVCRIHLKEGTGMQVWHPLEFLEVLSYRRF